MSILFSARYRFILSYIIIIAAVIINYLIFTGIDHSQSSGCNLMNGEYLKKMDFDKFYEMALPHMKEVVSRDVNFEKLAAMIKTRIEIWADIRDQIDFIEQVPDYDINMYVHKKNKTNLENSLEVLKEVQPLLEKQEDYSNDALFELLGQYAKDKEKKVGFVMWPIRVALSGKQMTPGGATELMEVLGKEESLARIQTAIDRLSQEA